jgi:hypothetical protein
MFGSFMLQRLALDVQRLRACVSNSERDLMTEQRSTRTAQDTSQVAPAAASGLARVWPYLVPAVLCLVALLRLHRAPELAANLDFAPDAPEYAIAAQRFAKLGSCSIEIDRVVYPSRYPPWFSVLVLAPFYAHAPVDALGIGIVPVYLLGVTAVMTAYALGRRISGAWGGALAGALLLFDHRFVFHSQMIITDVPVVALLLLLTLVLSRLRGEQYGGESEAVAAPSRGAWWWLAGALAALAGSFRVLAYAAVLPLLWQALRPPRSRGRTVHRLAAAVVPSGVMMLATAIYNQHAFGDWRRTGYQLWVSVPYDYLGLTFSLDYLRGNLALLGEIWVALAAGVAGGIVLLWRRPAGAGAGATLIVLALTALPISLVHLVYFFEGSRFHLPLIAVLSVVGGGGLALLVPARMRDASAWAACGPLLLLAQHGSQVVPILAGPPYRHILAEHMAMTEPNAVIITSVDPVYLEPMVLRGSQRRVIPLSREVEYASKVVTWRRIPPPLDPPPRSAFDHRAPALLRRGAREAVEFTAAEEPEQIEQMHRKGIPVYLDLSFTPEHDPAARRLIALFQSLGRPIGLPER